MENLLLLPASQTKIREASYKLNKINNDFKLYEKNYKEEKEQLQNIIKGYTDKNKIDEFGVKTKEGFFKIRPVINKKITWDIDKLSNKLDKEILDEVIIKQYSINDFDGLISYLKKCGVNPKKFKQFINVEKKVDNKKIDELGQFGEIDIEDLSGCFEIQATFSHVKISELEGFDAED